jgi:hypothetical protein
VGNTQLHALPAAVPAVCYRVTLFLVKIPHFLCHLATLLSASAFAGTVTNASDTGAGSLRSILASATNGTTIDFDDSLAGQTITLLSGHLPITGLNVIIDASNLIEGITISGNNASRIFLITGDSNVTLKNLHLVHGRETMNNGGGISAVNSSLHLEACSIRSCYAIEGGGLWGNTISGTITRCRIEGNQSQFFGGGIFLIGAQQISLSSVQITGNKGFHGAGIYNFSSSPTLINCTIHGNSGGGMRNERNSDPTLHNTIVWGNRAPQGTIAAQQINNVIDNNIPPQQSNPTISYSLVEGASGPASFNDGNQSIWSAGNLNGSLPANDPKFAKPSSPANAPTASADVRLISGSLALNAGHNPFSATDIDLAGKPRIQDNTVDLGAFEGGHVSFTLAHPGLDRDHDASGDGLTNFQAYALGIDPLSSAPPDSSPTIVQGPGGMTITGTHRANGLDILAQWETSDDLSPGSWLPLGRGIHYSGESHTYHDSGTRQSAFTLRTDATRRFYRLVIHHPE